MNNKDIIVFFDNNPFATISHSQGGQNFIRHAPIISYEDKASVYLVTYLSVDDEELSSLPLGGNVSLIANGNLDIKIAIPTTSTPETKSSETKTWNQTQIYLSGVISDVSQDITLLKNAIDIHFEKLSQSHISGWESNQTNSKSIKSMQTIRVVIKILNTLEQVHVRSEAFDKAFNSGYRTASKSNFAKIYLKRNVAILFRLLLLCLALFSLTQFLNVLDQGVLSTRRGQYFRGDWNYYLKLANYLVFFVVSIYWSMFGIKVKV
ncbi:hypothetical protein ACSTJT_20795 [Vibrio parahaemolyticus]